MDDLIEPPRGPGRPPCSPNKPKPAPMSVGERDALACQLAADLSEALVAQILASERIRGLKALAKAILGPTALHEIEAKLDIAGKREAEAKPDAA